MRNYKKVIFAGTKSDLRIEGSDKFVTTNEGKKMKSKIKAKSFIECSARLNDCTPVIEEAVRAVVVKKSSCSIL